MMFRSTLASAALLALLTVGAVPAHAQTVPNMLIYEGRILDGSGNPVTSGIVLRFSFWKSNDWTSGDEVADAINTAAGNYGGWNEVQTITPNGNGIIEAQLGSVVTLPDIDYANVKYLQIEAKAVGQPDSAYELLDPTGDDGADTNDRKLIASVAYALNADTVNNRSAGTASGNLLILGPGGTIAVAQMGDGTNAGTFTINADNGAGDAALSFGNAALQTATLTYSAQNSRFEFSADVLVKGDLTVGSGGTITASGSIATEAGLILNKDNTASDASITFGSSLGTKTLLYSSSNDRFEFNDDVNIAGNLTVTGTINGVNLDQNALQPLVVTAGAGLAINIGSGSYRIGSTITAYPGATGVSVTGSATNYVYFNASGLVVNTTGFPTTEAFIPLGIVTTSLTQVTAVMDSRVLQTDVRQQDIVKMLTPEFDKATYQGDSTANVGTLSMSQDNISQKNYYHWTTSRPTLQDYDVFVKVQLPKDFVGWASTPVQLQYRTTSADSANSNLEITIYDTNGSPVTVSGTNTGLASTSWATTDLDFTGTPTWTAGSEFLMKIHVSARNSYEAHIGSIRLHYTTLIGQ